MWGGEDEALAKTPENHPTTTQELEGTCGPCGGGGSWGRRGVHHGETGNRLMLTSSKHTFGQDGHRPTSARRNGSVHVGKDTSVDKDTKGVKPKSALTPMSVLS